MMHDQFNIFIKSGFHFLRCNFYYSEQSNFWGLVKDNVMNNWQNAELFLLF